MAKNKALSLRVRWLGENLRKARLQAGYTLEQAGEYLQIRHVTLSRFENGIYRPKPSYVRDLIDFYGISDERERAILLQLNEDAWRKDWWDGASAGFSMPFMDYTWLESRAEKLCLYEPLLIHGLLQTRSYAESLIRTGQGDDADPIVIQATIDTRMARQQAMHDERTLLDAVLDEGALRRRIGDRATHAQQLEHLINILEQGTAQVRVLAFGAGWHPGLDGQFTVIHLPDPYPSVVYIENLIGRVFLEEDNKVDQYQAAYDGIKDRSLTIEDSVKLIHKILKEIE